MKCIDIYSFFVCTEMLVVLKSLVITIDANFLTGYTQT